MDTVVPGRVATTRFWRSRVSSTGAPSYSTMTSAACMPASSAGPSGSTDETTTPRGASSPSTSYPVRGTSPMRMPITPRVTLPPRSSGSRSRTVLMGTANPTPALARRSLMIAVFMPMTSPRTFRSGPPELPGLIAASVCSISL